MRWRVRFSTRCPTWYYGAHTVFVDAADAHEAVALVEREHTKGDTTAKAWACTPASPEMEAKWLDLRERTREWIRLAKDAKAYRGLL